MTNIESKLLILQEFKKRKTRQIIITIPVVLIMIICFVLATVFKDTSITPDVLIYGIPSNILAICIGAVIFILIIASFINWRCPACNTYLGKAISPKFCISCGAQLQGYIPEGEAATDGMENIPEEKLAEKNSNNVKTDSGNIPLAILGGLFSSIICAAALAYVTYITNVQAGLMALGVGILVGYTVRILGKGDSIRFGIVGAVFSLIGCLMGNILAVNIMISKQELMPLLEVFSLLSLEDIYILMIETFNPKDLLFYAVAAYEGYKFSLDK